MVVNVVLALHVKLNIVTDQRFGQKLNLHKTNLKLI